MSCFGYCCCVIGFDKALALCDELIIHSGFQASSKNFRHSSKNKGQKIYIGPQKNISHIICHFENCFEKAVSGKWLNN